MSCYEPNSHRSDGIGRDAQWQFSLPYGLIRTVSHFLEMVGILRYLRGLKTKGVRLDIIVIALTVYMMHTSNSMNACAEWLKDEDVRVCLGFRRNENVSQKTIDRAVAILGRNREGIIQRLWDGIKACFEIDDYDINVDGSAVVLYGPKAEMGEVGYARDKNRGKLQVEFMVAQIASLGIPIYVKPYKGNASDEAQYRDCVPELAGLVSGRGIHAFDALKEKTAEKEMEPAPEEMMAAVAAVAMLGAAIVADNGAASEENLNRARAAGFGYITRVRMNSADDRRIRDEAGSFEYLGDGMWCLVHEFESSGRTTYLFLSQELFELNRAKAMARFEKDLRLLERIRSGEIRKSDFVKVRRFPWIDVETKVTIQEQLIPFSAIDKLKELRRSMGDRAGFFKLQSDVLLTPSEALRRYRRRAGIECVISSLKRITGIKPIRAWNDDTIAGSMVLALLSEASLAMARYCMKGATVEEEGEDGQKKTRTVKPTTESMVRSLNHLTVTRFKGREGRYEIVLSNWEPISMDIFDAIRAHEAPDWGNRKVPIPA